MTETTARRRFQYVTEGQADLIATMVEERFAADDAAREPFRAQFQAIRTRNDIDAIIADLRAVPTLAQRQRQIEQQQRSARDAEIRANVPTEKGLYVVPNEDGTGQLYRISKTGWDVSVSRYSVLARRGARRLLEDGTVEHIERGKWTKLSAWDSRRLINSGKLTRQHLLSDEDKLQWLTSFCNYCNRGLEDAESVLRNYGPKCAAKQGLPWGGLFEAKLAEQQAAKAVANQG